MQSIDNGSCRNSSAVGHTRATHDSTDRSRIAPTSSCERPNQAAAANTQLLGDSLQKIAAA